MEAMTPRQIKAQQTKKKILEVALDLFSKKGFDQVTVDEIVNTANSSKGAFYVHFNSKNEIFLEKFKEIDDFYDTFTQSLPDDMSYSEKIINLTKSQMVYLRDELGKDLMRTVYMSALTPGQPKTLSNTDRKLYKIIHLFVQKGQEKGEFKDTISAKEITMLITRCMRGTLYDWQIFNDDRFDLVEESQKFIHPIMASLVK
ncbi:TetR/AcrR family transcriptional regulator [Schinkia sp. CFF1]